MTQQVISRCRVLCLHAAAKRLGIPERTLRYQAGRGRIAGAFKEGKLWKFRFPEPAEEAVKRVESRSAGKGRPGGLPHCLTGESEAEAGGEQQIIALPA